MEITTGCHPGRTTAKTALDVNRCSRQQHVGWNLFVCPPVISIDIKLGRCMLARRNQTLKPRWFHILLALSDKDLHGSDIVREVLEQSDGELRLWPAMLYGSLEQMVDRGLIEELYEAAERPAGASAKRRYFRISNAGRKLLAAEADRMAVMARLARSKNILPEERTT